MTRGKTETVEPVPCFMDALGQGTDDTPRTEDRHASYGKFRTVLSSF